jgi:predicted acyl esterase
MADSYQAAYEDIVQTQKKALKLTPLRTSKPITDKSARFSGFRQGVKKFHVGQQIAKGGLKLPSDLVMHESVPTTLSDGTTLYSDIFLPPRFTSLEGPFPADNKVPALLVW